MDFGDLQDFNRSVLKINYNRSELVLNTILH
jgi:hypothetical protein